MSGAHLSVDFAAVDFSGLRNLPIEQALYAGAEVILDRAVELVPKEAGDLAASAFIDESRGGDSTVAVGFDSVYAAYIHEHLAFRHPHGGQAKYLEAAMIERKDDALDAMAEVLVGDR